jgi:hypothetical protein
MSDSSDIPAQVSDKTSATSDMHPTWSIRNFPPDTRNAAIAAARRDRVPIPVWLDAAIRDKIQASRRMPSVIPASNNKEIIGLEELERLSAVVAETALAGGVKSPSYMRGLIYKHVQARLKLTEAPLLSQDDSQAGNPPD